MATRQYGQRLHQPRHVPAGLLLGAAALVLVIAAAWAALQAQPLAPAAAGAQPAVGGSAVVTGLVYDEALGYHTAPVRVARPAQPAVGGSAVVTALVYDEALGYHTAAVRVAGR